MPSYPAELTDYHSHSTASDGQLSPTQLIHLAAEQGIKEMALTDHDTFAGIAEAQKAAAEIGVKLIPGMEFSTSWQGVGIHLVALWPTGVTPSAANLAEEQEDLRWQRADRIIQKLSKTPAAVSKEEVLAASNGQVPGRPHFAQAMINKGLVNSANLAFKKWLGSGKIGDIKNFWTELETAVIKLKTAGAFLSLAHPWQYKLTLSKRKRLLQSFAEAGGDAVEVVSGRQTLEQTASLNSLRQEFNLKATWGSDFHYTSHFCKAPGDYSPLPSNSQPLSHLFTNL